MQDLPLMKPAYCSLRSFSVPFLIRCKKYCAEHLAWNRQSIVASPVAILCQVSFLGKFHDSSFLPHLPFALRLGSAFSMSAVTLSSSGALFPLVCLMASSTSWCVMCPRFNSSCYPVCISTTTSGSSVFKMSRKCSAHLLSCSSSLVSVSALVLENC